MKLNIGSEDQHLEGYISVDKVPGPGRVVADLAQDWPWEDNSVEAIHASHIIEHLPDKVHTMNEAWRVLKPGGTLAIAVPTTDGPGAWASPEHVSYWNRNSFFFYEHGNPYWKRFSPSYGIVCAFRILAEAVTYDENGPALQILLQAVK